MHSVQGYQLVLASASPRRAELLRAMGVAFSVEIADIVEARAPGEHPYEYVQRLACAKAAAVRARVAVQRANEVLVLAADTIVVIGDLSDVTSVHSPERASQEQALQVLEKPQNYADAVSMWTSLSESEHTVITAVCVDAPPTAEAPQITRFIASSRVAMGPISNASMQRYWASGEPQDKAGAYALQGLASGWVRSISGSPSTIIGLPLYETNQLLAKYGLNWL